MQREVGIWKMTPMRSDGAPRMRCSCGVEPETVPMSLARNKTRIQAGLLLAARKFSQRGGVEQEVLHA